MAIYPVSSLGHECQTREALRDAQAHAASALLFETAAAEAESHELVVVVGGVAVAALVVVVVVCAGVLAAWLVVGVVGAARAGDCLTGAADEDEAVAACDAASLPAPAPTDEDTDDAAVATFPSTNCSTTASSPPSRFPPSCSNAALENAV